MNDTVVITAARWHEICHELKLDEYGGANDRKPAFEDCFNCTVTWKSRLDEWNGNPTTRPDPVMILKFLNPHDSTIFALKWAYVSKR